MATMPIRSMVPPTAIKDQPNGAVDGHLLAQVDDRTGYLWLLAELPARGMRALHAEVKARFGVQLSSTGRGRSYQMQYDAFLQRHDPVSKQIYDSLPASGGYRRFWPEAVTRHHLSSMYWALKKGMAAAAVPGTSPHGLWCADDICLPGNTPITNRRDVLDWLYLNGWEYGFAWSLASEPWHLQWYCGDTVPPAVVAHEQSQKPAPAPEEPPAPTPTEDDMALVIYKAENPPAVVMGYSSPPKFPAFQIEWLRDDPTIDAFRRDGGAIDYPAGPLQATAFAHCTVIGAVPPGWVEGVHYRQAVGS